MNNSMFLLGMVLLFLFSLSSLYAKGLPGDAEAASHGNEAATLQVIETITEKDFVFRQYDLAVLSHYSYLIASGGEALIIDPARDIAKYLKEAKDLNVKITKIYLTHSHADFVAGHMELMKATGAKIYFNKIANAKYKHVSVKDKEQINVGKVRTVVRYTPGHTPDGTSLFVYFPVKNKKPRLVLTGDTLFIGSVGRPDLMGGAYSAAELATMLYKTWTNILSKVPNETKVFPAHGAGSLCGAHLSDEPVSTFGEQKKTNTYLQHKDLSSFVMAVIDGLPQAPQYFKHNAAMNHEGPKLINWQQTLPKPLTPSEVWNLAKEGAWLLDVRDAKKFALNHAKNAINIGIRGRFETWTGIMIPWGEPFVLIGDSEEMIKEAAFRLHRIGYDSPAGYLKGEMKEWLKTKLPTQKIKLVKPLELYKQMKEGEAPVIVDVRLPKEWMGLRIGHVINFPINKLFTEGKRLDPNMGVLMVCNSAYRSSMAAGVMQKIGFKDVRNLEGGAEAWIEEGLPTFGAKKDTTIPPAPPPKPVYIDLPERISATTLAQNILDMPGAFDLFDIRPPDQFNEFHIPGSKNVMIDDIMLNPIYLKDKRPLVLICRDGNISASLAGALIKKTRRPIKYLTGGVQGYWHTVMHPQGIHDDTGNNINNSMKHTPPVPASNATQTKPQHKKKKRKKRRAGC